MCISEFRQGNSSSFYIRSNISKPVHLHFFYTYSWRRTTHPKGKHIWQNSTGLLTQMQRDDLHVKLSLPQNNLLNSSVIENKTCCVWNPYLSSPQLCLLSQRKCSVIPRSCFPSSHSQKLVIHPPLWVRVQLCFSDLFHCLRFFSSLQWFVRLRGSMRCSLFIQPQCFLNSTLLTCTSYLLLSYLPLPSSSLSV